MLKMVGTVGLLDLLISNHFCIECLPLKARLSRDGLCWGVEVIDIKISLAAAKLYVALLWLVKVCCRTTAACLQSNSLSLGCS